jgi:hypothetical protein
MIDVFEDSGRGKASIAAESPLFHHLFVLLRIWSKGASSYKNVPEGFLPSFKLRTHREESMECVFKGRSQLNNWLDVLRQFRE